MWIDFVENIFQYGKCQSITNELQSDKKQLKRELPYFMVYKVFSSIPLTVFSSFIVISLTYRTMINLIDFIYRNKSTITKEAILKANHDSAFCPICSVDDEHELIYSKFDLDYVLNIFELNTNNKKSNDSNYIGAKGLKTLNENLQHCKIKRVKESKIAKIRNVLYKPDPFFRFTSRYVNSIMVTIVALYYFVFYFGFVVITVVTGLTDVLRKFDDKLNQLQTLLTTSPTIKIGDVCEAISNELPFCVDSLYDIEIPIPKVPAAATTILQRLQNISIESSLEAIFIVPIFVALLICLLQLFLFVRESRLHMKQIQKGECQFVVDAKSLSNGSIASSSFHFGGYLVGYQLWGYVIL